MLLFKIMRKVISIALLAAGLLAVACTKEDDRSVKEVVLDKTDTSVVKGHDVQLTARVLPENALEKTIAWSSDNKSVAVVDQTGLVKALTVGSANITAEAGGCMTENLIALTTEIIQRERLLS